MTEWLKGCEICNAALCTRFKELIAQGMSQRQAALLLEKEQESVLGEVIYKAGALRERFEHYTGGRKSATQKSEQAPLVEPEEVPVPERAPPEPAPAAKPRRAPIPYTNAIQFGIAAISQLSRIEDADPKREEAIEMVQDWVNQNRRGRGES